MKIPVMLFIASFAHAIVAMDDASKTTNLNQGAQSSRRTLKGIVARSETGSLECTVTHDSVANTYSGTVYNRRYSASEWESSELDREEAQKYYQQLLQPAAAITTRAKAKDSNANS